jgi:hypothetical protein
MFALANVLCANTTHVHKPLDLIDHAYNFFFRPVTRLWNARRGFPIFLTCAGTVVELQPSMKKRQNNSMPTSQ